MPFAISSSVGVGWVFGALGGLSGVAAYHLIRIDENAQSKTTLEEKEPFDEFLNEETLHALDEEPVARLPK